MSHIYKSYNAAMATTAATVHVTTGTAIKTMLQLATPATRQIRLLEWGFSCDAIQSGVVELIQTDVAATVTAHVAAGVQPLDPNQPASLLTLSTSATGYTASAEGTPTVTRLFDYRKIVSGNTGDSTQYNWQWMPNTAPIVAVSRFVRVRVTFGTAVNMLCWVVWEE